MNFRRISRPNIFAATWLLGAFTVVAQDAVPNEILKRTMFIKVGNEAGTAFTIDHQGTIYIVTAKHVVTALPANNATFQMQRSGQWEDVHTVRTLYPPSSDVDIAVFETNEKTSQPFSITTGTKDDAVTFGQQVWFLGYPYGLGTRGSAGGINFEFPFIKKGTMSAIDATNMNAVVLYIDGFNNPGFSGGPILYWNFQTHVYSILGVVKGYKEDTAKIVVNGTHVDTQLLVNSGILVGYSIRHAIDAIEQAPKKP